MYEMYRYVFLGGAIACGLMFALSIALFFLLNIPKTISDLSGRTARKGIENIRLQNEQSGDKRYQSSAVNMQRGRVTDKISKSGLLEKRGETPFGTGTITEEISTAHLPVEAPASETTVLSPQNETTVLSTTASAAEAVAVTEKYATDKFEVEFEITFIHTNEVIT